MPSFFYATQKPQEPAAQSTSAIASSALQQLQNATASATPQNCKRKATQQASGER